MQVAQLEQDRQTVDRQRQELEEGYAANISTQSTVQKAAKNLVRWSLSLLLLGGLPACVARPTGVLVAPCACIVLYLL